MMKRNYRRTMSFVLCMLVIGTTIPWVSSTNEARHEQLPGLSSRVFLVGIARVDSLTERETTLVPLIVLVVGNGSHAVFTRTSNVEILLIGGGFRGLVLPVPVGWMTPVIGMIDEAGIENIR